MTTENLTSALAGKKVFVTGADGFIGSHVVETLIGYGADVKALCLYNSFGSYGWLDESTVFAEAVRDGQARPVLGDVRDAEHMAAEAQGTDVILHLGALIAIPYSYSAPRSYVETNIVGTVNMLEAARKAGVERFVNTSTSEVYGTPDSVPIREDHTLKGQSPYSASKIAADKMCESYALSFETPVTVLRPFNTYGPRQSARAVITTVMSQMLAGADVVKLGALSPQRDFTFATDTAEGFARAAVARLDPGTVVQLGTGRTVSIGDLVQMCKVVTGSTAEIVTDEQRIRPAGSEVQVLLSDPAKAKSLLGWEPAVGLEEGLRRTAEWLDGRYDAEKAGRYQK